VVSYSLVLHEEAARRIVNASRTEQRQLSVILDGLKLAPFRKGDLQELDVNDRVNEIMVIGDWLVTIWVDHAVREIRVVRIESSED
jgi:hypothetical protein